MTKTKYYDLQMDDPQDDYDVEVVNANLKKIDEQMKTRENATDALQEPEFTVADKRENIASKEKMPKILGKIAKFFTDLKTVAFSGKYSDLDGKPAIVNNNTATEAGSALDARQANPTIEGTMANQISQLNSDLNDINGSKATFNFLTSNISFRDAAKSTSDADMYAVADSKIAQHINTFSNGQIVNLSTTGSVYTYTISKFNDKWWSVDVTGYNVLYFLRLAYRDGTYCVIRVLQ